MTIRLQPADFLNPLDSEHTLIGEEDAAHCDGVVCDQQRSEFGETGKSVRTSTDHLVVTEKKPYASPRYYPI